MGFVLRGLVEKMIDQIIVGLYLLITLVVGLYVGRDTENIKEYAIGKRDFSTLILISAVFASVVDASGTIGLAGNTFTLGPIFLLSYLGIIFSRFTLALFIAPKMKPFLGLISAGDIFEKLFGRRAKTLMGISTIIESTLMAGAQVLAISHLTQYFFGVSSEIAAIGGSIVMILYSFRGGIKSVTATDVFQFGILIIAIPIICGVGMIEIGGYKTVISTLKTTGLSFNKGDGIPFGHHLAVFISFALPCLYPMCIQRMLMAKNTSQIRTAFLVNGFLSIPFYITVGMIGIIAFIVIPNVDANHAVPALVDRLVPLGLKGFVIAGLLAIFMSTADSILNIGAIALTHDLVGSIVKAPLKAKTELFLVRASSIAIALGAIIIAVKFNNVLDVIFLIMVLGNSVFFPGYLLGILNLHGSRRAFWIGVTLGVTSVAISICVFDMFLLYAMLLAISINISVHLIELGITKRTVPFSIRLVLSTSNKNIFTTFSKYFLFNNWIRNQDYCSIFAICSISISLLPFFGHHLENTNQSHITFLALNATTAVLSFIILFREIWRTSIVKYFPLLWVMLLIVALPLQTIFMFVTTKFSLVWLIDSLAILPLLSMLTSRKGVVYSYVIGGFLAVLLSTSYPFESEMALGNLGLWTVLIHTITLAICLALFRKRDVELCRSTSTTLVHEANRSLSTFENAAIYYESLLPTIISHYKEHVPPEKRMVNSEDLDEMLLLPTNLKQVSSRTKNALSRLLDSVTFYSSKRQYDEICDIHECVSSAIADPIFSLKSHIIKINNLNSFRVIGDRSQLIQIFINLIENSIHAVRHTKEPIIEIVIDKPKISISDNGEGISEANLPNIFDELFSTKPFGGQGLAYCKKIITDHGGSISCQSKSDNYTIFDLTFPQSNIDGAK